MNKSGTGKNSGSITFRVDDFARKLKALKNRASESRNEACFGYAECSRFY